MGPKADSSRKPPEPVADHAVIDEWMRKTMPDLNPIVTAIDAQIRKAIKGAQFAVKWKKAYYGTAALGWVIELVSYDVSVNVVFHAGADFKSPPPLGEGRGRYIKVRSLEEAETPEMQAWIAEAAKHPGWQ